MFTMDEINNARKLYGVKNSKLVALFESSAKPYKNKVKVMEEELLNIEVDDAIKKLELKKDTR